MPELPQLTPFNVEEQSFMPTSPQTKEFFTFSLGLEPSHTVMSAHLYHDPYLMGIGEGWNKERLLKPKPSSFPLL